MFNVPDKVYHSSKCEKTPTTIEELEKIMAKRGPERRMKTNIIRITFVVISHIQAA